MVSSRRTVYTFAISAAVLIGGFAITPATSASAAPVPATVSVRSASALVPNMPAPPTGTVPSPPYGDLSTTFAYCDKGTHPMLWGVGIMTSYYQETGIWNNRWYQEYWLVYAYFGGGMDVGYAYRWC